ncbi:hypothetical protein C8P63_11779 [Melghirimyces profundicolus]|uniref:Uncharacterized protein n=1 Tax=Melghirimyces profundicolus TaxID=1242148 RepID=A0A2T6BQG6_9BACL|nr:hypothetical protein [Melghirimyces profundicolus]PTX58331.1 hypothetical protein C8P63_11779 [Melghirimyces profundicolus]
MNDVILITGKVKYQINLDPSVWIFDDRRFEMEERFPGVDGLGMELGPFLENAAPEADAQKLIIHRRNKDQVSLSLEEARSAVLQFAREGKPIRPDGPALLYLSDGSNKEHPVDFIEKMEVV